MSNEKNLKPFKKGDKRINREGRPKTKHITEWLNHPDRKPDLDKMLKKTLKLAIGGNMTAVQYITDRLEGKPKSYLDFHIENTRVDEPIKVFDFVGQTVEEYQDADDEEDAVTLPANRPNAHS